MINAIILVKINECFAINFKNFDRGLFSGQSTLSKALRNGDNRNENSYCIDDSCPDSFYKDFCKLCSYDSSIPKLTCTCPKFPYGSTISSKSGTCSGYYFNSGGELICLDWCQQNNCPSGPYQDYCVDCSITNNLLTCSCANSLYTFKKSSMALPCAKRIEYKNPNIVCV